MALSCSLASYRAQAQSQSGAPIKASGLTITASATGDRVRFTAPSSVVQIRLEVYNSAGRKLFDNELRGGNVLDWHMQDGQAEPLLDSTYLCVVTVKSLSGRITQRVGFVKIEQSAAKLQATETAQMTPQQVEAIGPVEENAALTILEADQQPTTTVLAHNGEDGQISRGKGALSFRLGDFFSGKDTEQMRLTAEGNLGIGLSNPAVKLDVNGFVRASQGIVFPDGSVQYSAARKTYGSASLGAGQFSPKRVPGQEHLEFSPTISGSGTTGKLSKWLDGPSGVLNDANITEVSGAIGINGSPDTRFRLDVNGSTRIRGSNPGFNLEGLRAAGNVWAFQTVDDDGRFRLFGQDNVNPGVERLTIKLDTGNVGIGATNPTARLQVGSPGNNANSYTARLQSSPSVAGAGGILFDQNSTYGWKVHTENTGFTNGLLNFNYINISTGASLTVNPLVLHGNGNVGIGTNNPTAARLQVFDNSLGVAVYGTSAFSSGGITLGGVGVLGETQTADGVGVYGRNLFGGFAMYADGNTSQARNKGGWVKALLKVNFNGGIERCYNGITGSAGGTCGFSVNTNDFGLFDINFGFRVDDRFASVTADAAGQFGSFGEVIYGFGNQNTIRVVTRVASSIVTNSFTIIVY
jgi:hypothetical protein